MTDGKRSERGKVNPFGVPDMERLRRDALAMAERLGIPEREAWGLQRVTYGRAREELDKVLEFIDREIARTGPN